MKPELKPNELIKVACLGITHPHTSGRVKALNALDNVEVSCIVDDSEFAQPFANAFALDVRTLDEVLEDDTVQVVIIHSKSYAMADLAVQALEANKAVLVEKPAGRNAADARRIAEAVDRTQGFLQIGYCWHFSPAISEMQKVLDEGRLGDVLQVRGHAACAHHEAATAHLNQEQDMGGALFVIGCHLFDRIIYHFGMPTSVNARVRKFPGAMPDEYREDAAGAILSYPDKIVCADFYSWDPMPWLESWDFVCYGTKGTMHSGPLPASYEIYDSQSVSRPAGWTKWKETEFPVQWASRKTDYSPELAEIGNLDFFQREAESFIHSLRNGLSPEIPARQAYDVNRLIEALFESESRNGGEVIISV